MAALYALSNDAREYFDWHVGNCQGYCVDVEGEGDAVRLVNPQRFADLSFLNDAIALPPESFFQNRSCKYFPCHEGVDEADFNCLFCYCPLYALGPGCGGNYTYTKKGYKNCVNCAVPHVRDNGVRLAKEHFKQLAELAKQE